MATEEKVKIEITEDGDVEFEVQGVKGRGCVSLLEDVLAQLGQKKGELKPTHEMHEVARVTHTVKR